MKKIVTVVGARPQFIKAAAMSYYINKSYLTQFIEIIIHTGQHYDENMSSIFFEELGIPKPMYNLNIGSANQGEQTAKMIEGIEKILIEEKPEFVLLYGDTNSTLAGAISASKLSIKIIHVEAGLRSFNKEMPEEINRILTDHCSTFLFPPTEIGITNLYNEGFIISNTLEVPIIRNVGDIMYDVSLLFSNKSDLSILEQLEITTQKFILVTLHRNTNTDNKDRLLNILKALNHIATKYNELLIIPLHPRTRNKLEEIKNESIVCDFFNSKNIKIIQPTSFLQMIALETHSQMIFTDSGGVQKEAYFYKKPCVIFRKETEWIEIVKLNAAKLCDANVLDIISAYEYYKNNKLEHFPNLYGDGTTSINILEILSSYVLKNEHKTH